MTIRTVTKSLAGMEDLAAGIGNVVQQRGGTQVTVGKIDQAYAVLTEQDLADLDVTLFTFARLDGFNYSYDPDDDTGVLSNVGPGSWLKGVGGDSTQIYSTASKIGSLLASANIWPFDRKGSVEEGDTGLVDVSLFVLNDVLYRVSSPLSGVVEVIDTTDANNPFITVSGVTKYLVPESAFTKKSILLLNDSYNESHWDDLNSFGVALEIVRDFALNFTATLLVPLLNMSGEYTVLFTLDQSEDGFVTGAEGVYIDSGIEVKKDSVGLDPAKFGDNGGYAFRVQHAYCGHRHGTRFTDFTHGIIFEPILATDGELKGIQFVYPEINCIERGIVMTRKISGSDVATSRDARIIKPDINMRGEVIPSSVGNEGADGILAKWPSYGLVIDTPKVRNPAEHGVYWQAAKGQGAKLINPDCGRAAIIQRTGNGVKVSQPDLVAGRYTGALNFTARCFGFQVGVLAEFNYQDIVILEPDIIIPDWLGFDVNTGQDLRLTSDGIAIKGLENTGTPGDEYAADNAKVIGGDVRGFYRDGLQLGLYNVIISRVKVRDTNNATGRCLTVNPNTNFLQTPTILDKPILQTPQNKELIIVTGAVKTLINVPIMDGPADEKIVINSLARENVRVVDAWDGELGGDFAYNIQGVTANQSSSQNIQVGAADRFCTPYTATISRLVANARFAPTAGDLDIEIFLNGVSESTFSINFSEFNSARLDFEIPTVNKVNVVSGDEVRVLVVPNGWTTPDDTRPISWSIVFA